MAGYKQHIAQTDEELLHLYRKCGDNSLLGLVLQRYTTLLFGVAYKYLKNKTSAEDAVQQVFLKVITKLPQEEILNFKGWLYILMRNHCLQQLRDTTRFTDDSGLEQVYEHELEKEELYWQEHNLQQMEHALQEISLEQKISIELFYLKKYTYEQIMQETGFNFMQVKSYIQNGKRNLKNILAKKLGLPEK